MDFDQLFKELFGKQEAGQVFDWLVSHPGERLWANRLHLEFNSAWIELLVDGTCIIHYTIDLEHFQVLYQ